MKKLLFIFLLTFASLHSWGWAQIPVHSTTTSIASIPVGSGFRINSLFPFRNSR